MAIVENCKSGTEPSSATVQQGISNVRGGKPPPYLPKSLLRSETFNVLGSGQATRPFEYGRSTTFLTNKKSGLVSVKELPEPPLINVSLASSSAKVLPLTGTAQKSPPPSVATTPATSPAWLSRPRLQVGPEVKPFSPDKWNTILLSSRRSTPRWISRRSSVEKGGHILVAREVVRMWDTALVEEWDADLVLHTSDGMELAVQSKVLASHSPVIAQMIRKQLLRREPRPWHLSIPGVPHGALRAFVRFLYSAQYDDEEVEGNILPLTMLAHKYRVPILKHVCLEELEYGLLSAANAADALQLARLCGEPELAALARAFVMDNFNDVAKTEGWRVLGQADPVLERELLEASLREHAGRVENEEAEEEDRMYAKLHDAEAALRHICRDGCRSVGPNTPTRIRRGGGGGSGSRGAHADTNHSSAPTSSSGNGTTGCSSSSNSGGTSGSIVGGGGGGTSCSAGGTSHGVGGSKCSSKEGTTSSTGAGGGSGGGGGGSSASAAPLAACGFIACKHVEVMLRHFSLCRVKVSGGCSDCQRMWHLLELHSRMCFDSGSCNVPLCRLLFERRSKAKRADEWQWATLIYNVRSSPGTEQNFSGDISFPATVFGKHPNFDRSVSCPDDKGKQIG